MMEYSLEWYKSFVPKSERSAEIIVPMIMEKFHPQSVIDFGCGLGSWLSIFKKNGCGRIAGYDGDYVDQENLLIDKKEFRAADLGEQVKTEQKYDLAISLEVAEHIEEAKAERFVKNITEASDIVLFSAALPCQGGRNHVNEQWPGYWKSLFEKAGYLCCDWLREKIWNNPEIRFWYSQNTVLYVKGKEKLASLDLEETVDLRGMIHPGMLMQKQERIHSLSVKSEKLQTKYNTCIQWIKFQQTYKQESAGRMAEYVKQFTDKAVIYGYGELGRMFYETIKDKLLISYILDVNAQKLESDEVIFKSPEDVSPDDFIIISAVDYQEQIENKLRSAGHTGRIIALNDLLEEAGRNKEITDEHS